MMLEQTHVKAGGQVTRRERNLEVKRVTTGVQSPFPAYDDLVVEQRHQTIPMILGTSESSSRSRGCNLRRGTSARGNNILIELDKAVKT